jgi:fermentation-respiration switch protein FrsA (DUF1100 family)
MTHPLEICTDFYEGIPFLTVAPAGAGRRPLIAYICGYGGAKEHGLPLGYALARRGYVFLAFDPPLHGERFDPQLFRAAEPELGGVCPPESGLDIFALFFRSIARSVADLRTLLAALADDPRVDVGRCGVTGLSMGGYATCQAFAEIQDVRAAAAVVGVPSFLRRWRDVVNECRWSNPAWDASLIGATGWLAAQEEFIRRIDPIERLAQAAPRALFLLNGDFDTDQPKHYSIETYGSLRKAYAAAPERLRLGIYPAGHTLTEQMQGDIVEWFGRFLAI